MREKEKQLVVSEVNILRELKHPFIVRYYDRIIDKLATRLYIVMEYCEGGDLGAIVKKCKKEGSYIEEDFIWNVFAQILVALHECHRHKEPSGRTKPILHRDLKPGNIFLDASQIVKIGDFGLAKELASESKFAYTNVGTPFYMSPEMVNELKYNEKSDIWALGCLLYELTSLAPPFEATNHLSLAVKINAGKFNRPPARYSEDLYRTIRWMLQVDSTKRPTVEELERVPRLKQGLDRALLIVSERARAAAGAAQPTRPPSAAGNKEEELAQREAEVSRREQEVTKREASAADWERALRERELAVAAKESSFSSMRTAVTATRTQQISSASAGGFGFTAAAVAPPQPPSLHRAYSAGEFVAPQARRSTGLTVGGPVALRPLSSAMAPATFSSVTSNPAQSEVAAPIVHKIDLLAVESSSACLSPGAQMVEVDSPASLPAAAGITGMATENSTLHTAGGAGPFAVKLFTTETQQRPSSRGAVGF